MQTIRPRYSTILTWNLLIFVFHILSFSLCAAQDQSVVNCTDMLGYHMTFLAIVVKSSGHSILNVLIKLSWEYTESSKTSHCYPSNFEFFLSYWSTLWVLYYVTRQPDKILDFLRVWVMEDAELDLATFEFKRIIHIPWRLDMLPRWHWQLHRIQGSQRLLLQPFDPEIFPQPFSQQIF